MPGAEEEAPQVSHNLWRPIKEGEGQLNVIVTISSTTKVASTTTTTTQANSPSNLATWSPEQGWESKLEERYVGPS